MSVPEKMRYDENSSGEKTATVDRKLQESGTKPENGIQRRNQR
jgi:hypothetical protein